MEHRGFALFRNDFDGNELFFHEPESLILAEDPADFADALARMEGARAEGRWLAGYFSYEAGYLFEKKLAPLLPAGRRAPLACFGVFKRPSESEPRRVLPSRSNRAPGIEAATARWSAEDYEARFERLHAHLRAGDCYQGNLTFPIDARWEGEPLSLFEALAERQPVRHSALLELAGPVVLSRSPELFFQVGRDGWIESLPMKGTAPRGSTRQEDEDLARALAADPKTQAENRMIVDLLRNDISRISEVGTLDVPELFAIQSFATVHQMVSRVRARLLPGLTIAEIFAALFPCGSITGAPKMRAMEILRGLEEAPRDVYCGAIGWISPGGPMRFSVAIRTLSLFDEGRARYDVGGGVVFDSTSAGEYEECLWKARFATGETVRHRA